MKILEFTGITPAHGPPEAPEVEVHLDLLTVEASVTVILEAVQKRLGPTAAPAIPKAGKL